MRIIYPNETGVSVIYSTGELPLDEVASKDVPAGVPFLIIEDGEVPTNREDRKNWTVDFSAPHGYGADYGVGTPWLVTAIVDGVAVSAVHEETGAERLLNAELQA